MNHLIKRTAVTLSAISLLAVPTISSAASDNQISIVLDGSKQAYAASPYVKQDRTFVPLRGIFEQLGATVQWDEATQTVTATKDDTTIILRIGSSTATVNGTEVKLDAAAEANGNYTMVPLRFVGEALGAEVRWDEAGQTVRITSKDKKDKVLHLALTDNPPTLDPAKASEANAFTLLEQTGEGLIRTDKDGKLVPGAAKDWTISADGLTYTFRLNPNAKWSDGSKVTAQDFEYAWKRALDPKTASTYAFLLNGIRNASLYNQGKATANDVGVTALDDKTLQVTLEAPEAYFMRLTTFPTFFPVKQSAVEAGGEDFGAKWDANVYNGPFTPDAWELGKSVKLVKNEQYWDNQDVKLGTIDYVFGQDAAHQKALYDNGLIDAYVPTVDTMPANGDSSSVVTEPSLGRVHYLQFNQKDTVLQNAKIRQALTYAIDGAKYAEAVYGDFAHDASGFVPTEISDGSTATFRETAGDLLDRQHNVAKAKQLLDEGFKELGLTEFPKLSILMSDTDAMKKGGDLFKADWKNILGIDVDVVNVPHKELQQRIYKTHDFDIALIGWLGDYDDPASYLDLWTTNGDFNSEGYSNPEYDALIKQAQQETDLQKRTDILVRAEKFLLDDMIVGPMYFNNTVQVTHTYVKGLETRTLGPMYDLKDTYIEGKN